MEHQALLAVDQLSLCIESGRRQRQVVDDLSLFLHKNRILGLIGESGCGKSLTCLALMGLLPKVVKQTGGAIRFKGQAIHGLPFARMRTIRGNTMAMIMQNPMSCFDAVFTLRHHFMETIASHKHPGDGHADTRIKEALHAVGFDEPDAILDLYPFQLSGGMLQRAMVALALMMQVQVLIADEPTTDLDVVSQAKILDLLAHVRDTHQMAVLLVTHDLGVIARLADDVAVMYQGRIVETGDVTAIFDRTSHPYTGELMAAHFNLYGQRLERIRSMSE
jgi:nickel transport system ATP-binding protein